MAPTAQDKRSRPLLRGTLTAIVVFFLVLFVMGQFGGGAGPGEVALVAVIAAAAGLVVWYVTRKLRTSSAASNAATNPRRPR